MRALLRIGVFSTAFAMLTSVVNAQFAVEPTTLPLPTAAPIPFHSGLGFVANGQLEGRAVTLRADGSTAAVPGAIVKLLKDTVEIGSTVADENGDFTFPQIGDGSYGIIVESQDAFAAHSFRAVTTSTPRPLEVYTSTMRRPQVEAVWQSLWTPDGAPMNTGSMPGATALDGAQVQSPVVRMRGGEVVGRLVFENSLAIPARHFVKVYDATGALVGTTRVTEAGEFAIALAGPGLYNFIVGGQGYACISVKVVAENGVAQTRGSAGRFVSKIANQVGSDYLVIPVIGPAPQPPVIVEDIPPPIAGPGGFPMYGPSPMGGGFGGGGGGFGGGAGGGFGGGGGLGGLGGLLGIGGLAAGIVALSDDDDGFNGSPGTPIVP